MMCLVLILSLNLVFVGGIEASFFSKLFKRKSTPAASATEKCDFVLGEINKDKRYIYRSRGAGGGRFRELQLRVMEGTHPDTELLIIHVESYKDHLNYHTLPLDIDKVFDEYLDFVVTQYKTRRGENTPHQWSEKFINKLKDDFLKSIDSDAQSQIIIARDKKTKKIQGVIRLIDEKPKTYTDTKLVNLPTATYLGLDIYIPPSPYIDVTALNPHVAAHEPRMKGGPGMPTDYLGFGYEGGEALFKRFIYEPANFIVDHNLQKSLRESVRSDLWISYVENLVYLKTLLDYSDFSIGVHFISYADPASLTLYRPMGWVPLHEVAEKYGILNKADPQGKFSDKPIVVDGVSWVPIYTNPVRLIAVEDYRLSNSKRELSSNQRWFRHLKKSWERHFDKGYDFTGQPVTHPEAQDVLHLNYPNTFMFLLEGIKNFSESEKIPLETYWMEMEHQLYHVAVMRDSIARMDSAPVASMDPLRQEALKVFRAQAQEVVDYYEKVKNELAAGIMNHVKKVFAGNDLEMKKETLRGVSFLFGEDRFMPGLWKMFNLIPRNDLLKLFQELKAKERDPELLSSFNNRIEALKKIAD